MSDSSRLLQAAGVVVALAAVSLPVVGGGVRWIAFALTNTVPADLAFRAPIPLLAATGFWAVAPSIFTFLVVFTTVRSMAPGLERTLPIQRRYWEVAASVRRVGPRVRRRWRRFAVREPAATTADSDRSAAEWRRESEENKRDSEALERNTELLAEMKREIEELGVPLVPPILMDFFGLRRPTTRGGRILSGLIIAFLAVALVFLTFPAAFLTTAAGFVAYIWTGRLAMRSGKVPLFAAWPAAAILLATSTIASGLNPSFAEPPAAVVLAGAQAPTMMTRVGDTDGLQYLLRCGGDSTTQAVTTTRVESMTYEATKALGGASLFGVLRGEPLSLGFRARC